MIKNRCNKLREIKTEQKRKKRKQRTKGKKKKKRTHKVKEKVENKMLERNDDGSVKRT
jgi:hypothetical protein